MKRPDFDPIARPYRWLEYLTLGSTLQRTRVHFLPMLRDRRRALVLGDGDGRFLARLLAQNDGLRADAVDLSATMLRLLRGRAEGAQDRLTTHQQDALTFRPAASPDLVVTHFFLDCLTQSQVDELAARLAPSLEPEAIWLVSDFRIAEGPLRLPSMLYIRSLYVAFRLITGLRVTRLPDHAASLRAAGFNRFAEHKSLFGMLTTELWRKECSPSQQ